MLRNKILYTLLFIYNLSFSQENFTLKTIDSITKLPIEDVKIYKDGNVLAITDKEGNAIINNATKNIILVSNNYHDIEIENPSSKTIALLPITTVQLDEIIVNTYEGATVLDKIYNVYLKMQNYKIDCHFKNMTIKLSANEKKIVEVDEMFYKGDKVKKKTKRILDVERFQSTNELVNYGNQSYPIPIGAYSKNSFFHFYEIHDFFKSPKKFKYKLNEYENHLSIDYDYKDIYTKLKFKISLIVDKNNYCIISYDKKLLPGKNTVYHLNNLKTKQSQDFKFSEYNESVLFEINELGDYELISENSSISYSSNSNGETVNFKYFYNLEPTIPFDYNPSDLVDFNKLVN